MNVYVVCAGERGEGHDPVSAHGNYSRARVAAEALNPGQRMARVDVGRWKSTKPGGVDEVWIYRLAVADAA